MTSHLMGCSDAATGPVVLSLGDADDRADLHALAASGASTTSAMVCLVTTGTALPAAVQDDCADVARGRPVLVVRHPAVDAALLERGDEATVATVAAVRGAVRAAAEVSEPGLREVEIS